MREKVMAEDASIAYSEEEAHARPRRRPTRACTARTAARLAPPAPAPPPRTTLARRKFVEYEPPVELAPTPSLPAQSARWQLRSMWELASVLNFFNAFRPLLGFEYDFTADELETALLLPNSRLDDIHLALLKAIPPAARTALTRDTWVTVLCKKLKDWWRKVAEGPCPLVANHGAEIQLYKEFDPGMRLQILKALCEIRLEQDDMRTYVDDSLKQGYPVSSFRKEHLGPDIHGTTYWYEDDVVLGQRLYRELPRVEPTRAEPKNKSRGSMRGRAVPPPESGQWETVATNFDEFKDVMERLCASKSKLEINLGRMVNTDILPDIEELHKKRERALKKQARQAMLLETCLGGNGLAAGRSRRDRKPVTYTFDDYDRSIAEAIKFTKNKKHPSPEPPMGRRDLRNTDARANGMNGRPEYLQRLRGFSTATDPAEVDHPPHVASLRSGRQARRTQKYPDDEYIREVDGEVSSDEEIIGEAIFDEAYLKRKRRRRDLSSDRDEEYRAEEDEYDAEDDQGANVDSDYVNSEDESSGSQGVSRPTRGRVRSAGDAFNWGLRRSNRSTRGTAGYGQYDSEYEDMDGTNGDHSYRVGRGALEEKEAEDSGAGESQESQDGSQEQSVGPEEDGDEEDDSGSRDYGGGDMATRPHTNGVYVHDDFPPDELTRPELLDLNQAVANGCNIEEVPGTGTTKLRLRLGVQRPPKTDSLKSGLESDRNQSDRVGGLENGRGAHTP